MDPEDEDLHDEALEDEDNGNQDEKGTGSPDDAAGQDEGQADGEAGAEAEVRAEPVKSRAESRFQKLSNEAREAREHAARVEREFQEFRAEQSRRAAQVEKKEPTAEEMALWSTEQVIDYKLGKATENQNRVLQQMQFQNMENNDRSKFEALKLSDPRAKRYADEVERELGEIRKKGQNVDRESLYFYLLGKKVATNAPKATAKAKKEGEAQIRRARTTPPAGQSDVRGGRAQESEAEARRRRLENVTF